MYTLLIKLYYANEIAEALLLDTLSHHAVLNPIYVSRRDRDDSSDANKKRKRTHIRTATSSKLSIRKISIPMREIFRGPSYASSSACKSRESTWEESRARGTPVHRYLQFFRFPRTPAPSCSKREDEIEDRRKSARIFNRNKSRIPSREETRRDASDSAVQCELTTSHAIPCHAPFHSATVPFGLIPRMMFLSPSFNISLSLSLLQHDSLLTVGSLSRSQSLGLSSCRCTRQVLDHYHRWQLIN